MRVNPLNKKSIKCCTFNANINIFDVKYQLFICFIFRKFKKCKQSIKIKLRTLNTMFSIRHNKKKSQNILHFICFSKPYYTHEKCKNALIVLDNNILSGI